MVGTMKGWQKITKTLFEQETSLSNIGSGWYIDAKPFAGKKYSRASLRELVSQEDGWQTLFRLWESLDCVPDSLLATAAKLPP